MRISTLLALAAVTALVAACSKSDDNANTTDPAVINPLPSANTPGAAPADPMPAASGAIAPTPAAPATPRTTVTDAGTPADAGMPTDAGTPTDAGAPADAGASAKLTACATKCQGILQSCATPVFPADGGMPQIKDPQACQAAFDACRTACVP